MNYSHKGKGARYEIIYFNFRLDIGITELDYVDKFVPIIEHMKGERAKSQSTLREKIQRNDG